MEKVITAPDADSSYYLSVWVQKGSIRVYNGDDLLSENYWSFNAESGFWALNTTLPDTLLLQDNLRIRYRILPISIPRTLRGPPIREVSDSLFNAGEAIEPRSGDLQGVFNRSDLRQQGSLSRGIIVGSNQDFSLESGLNFELTGNLTDDIRINASLTDQSIPIQPDGTTQNLREFDRVFIELQAPNAGIRMGDIDVSLEQNIFSRYHRRLQGAAGNYRTEAGNYNGAVSVVRGTFRTINFQGSDGVQGPYRLTGRNNEPFVIILAGTEKVYINGQQVDRGADNDYIIDYGLGEIYFTENILIKDETRIFVEYEYLDQDFNRTLMAAEASEAFLNGKLRLGATVIRQADGDDLLSQQNLTEDDINFLEGVGDDLDNALVDGATVATEEERDRFVIYSLVDTTLNGQQFEIYQSRPGETGNVFRVRFSNVGEGQGAYRRVGGTVNGILYEWVGPGNGSYEPFRRLPAPEKQQMVALNTDLALSDKIQWYGEWALSDYDKNRFSSLDNGDNTDLAYNSGLRISNIRAGSGTISAEVNSRYSGRNFQFFERIREIEFSRKWNLSELQNNRELINTAKLRWDPAEHTSVAIEGGTIERDGFEGFRQEATVRSDQGAFLQSNYLQEYIRSEDRLIGQSADWFRQIGSVSKDLQAGEWGFRPYVSFWQEDRRQRDLQTDSLTRLSERFLEVGPGLELNVGALTLDGSLVVRDEKGVSNGRFREQAHATEQRYRAEFRPSPNFSTRQELKIRDKDFSPIFEQLGNTGRKGIFFRSQTEYRTADEWLEGDLTYRVNTQRQSILQESYIEVGPELGQYVWRDINQDGVQQIDEFFPELSPNEGLYVRQFLPSDELLPVVDLNVRSIQRFRPLQFLSDAEWLQGVSLFSRVDIRENSRTAQLDDVYLLRLNTFRSDSTTLDGRVFWEKELDLLGGVDPADLRLGYNENRTFSSRATETLRGYNSSLFLNSSWRGRGSFGFDLNLTRGINRNISDRLLNRNYDISSWSVNPGTNIRISRSWQTGLRFSYISKTDRVPSENVDARILKIENTQRAYIFERIQTNSRIELRNTRLSGQAGRFGVFELTEGTGEGTNIIWSLNAGYRVSSLVRVTFNYDGRTVEDRPAIHTIKLVVSAVF